MNGSRSRGPEVWDIVSCCTKSGRGVSVDSDDRAGSSPFPLTSNYCRFSVCHEAPLVALRHFYRYRRLVRRRTLLQPGVSSTLRITRREVVASCESNLGYPKPSSGVDSKGFLTCSNFAVSISCFLVKRARLFCFPSHITKKTRNVRI